MMRNEIERRHSNAEKVLALFKGRPRIWVNARDLMVVGGAMAWRTRVSDARHIVKAEGGRIENRVRTAPIVRDEPRVVVSEYRYVPAEAPFSATTSDQPNLFSTRGSSSVSL